MFSTIDRLKLGRTVSIDSGYVNHIARYVAYVWDHGKIVRWGYQTACLRLIESKRMGSFFDPRPICIDCKRRRGDPIDVPASYHRASRDMFNLYAWCYKNQGIGTFVQPRNLPGEYMGSCYGDGGY